MQVGMLTLIITAQEQHNRFIKRVVESSQVWALNNPDGKWVFSGSNENEAQDVFTVWSDKAYAKRCGIEEWHDYTPASIPLAEFLEAWCAGLHNKQELVGTNWDTELRGLEIQPLELVLQILLALKEADKQLPLKNYANQIEFEIAIRRSIV